MNQDQEAQNIIDLANTIYQQDQRKIKRYEKWESYIVPLVREKFLPKFELQYRYRVSLGIQEFIAREENKFLDNN